MLGMGFFMGCFLATLQVPAETLITIVGSDQLDMAFFLSGILGVLSAGLYVSMQRHISFRVLATINALLIFFGAFAIRLAFFYFDLKDVAFALFLMLGPLTSITLLTFWGIFGRMFDLRASKRIIGGVDTGQLTATCAAFFAISFVSDHIQTIDLLWVSVISCFGFFLTVLYVCLRDPLDKQDVKVGGLALSEAENSKAQKEEKVTYMSLIKNKYFLFLSIFLACSVSLSKLNEYSYRSVMEIYAGGDESVLNTTYALIDAIIIVISFLIQSFLNDFIIGRFGLKISLMAMPVILGLFTAGAIVAGHLFVYDTAAPGFFVFFSFNVMGRILTASLRDALESPAFKMFFFPINAKDRFDVQSRVEGVVKEFSGLLVGAGLIFLSGLAYFKLIHASYLVIGVMLVTMLAVVRLYNQYKVALKSSLSRQKGLLQEKIQEETRNLFDTLTTALQRSDTRVALFALRIMEYLFPAQLHRTLVQLLQSPLVEVRKYSYRTLQRLNVFNLLSDIEPIAAKEKDEATRAIATEVIGYLRGLVNSGEKVEHLLALARDADPKVRLRATCLLGQSEDPASVPMLLELTHDSHQVVVQSAIMQAAHTGLQDYWSMLFGKLHDPTYGNTALSALLEVKKAEQNIDLLFYRTDQHYNSMYRVGEIVSMFRTPSALERIWKKLDDPNHNIFHACIHGLHANGYKASTFKGARIRLYIDHLIEDLGWNIYALEHIPTDHPVDTLLRVALEEENMAKKENLFMAMTMIYDTESVRLVKENIEYGTPESLTYAIELMNTFIEDLLKPKLFPLFDDLLPAERIKRLSEYFAPERFRGYEDVLLQIINRDYNHMSRWCKALSLYRLSSLSSATVSRDLIANVYNPDYLLLQTTAFALLKKDPQQYRQHTQRITTRLSKKLDMALLPPLDRVGDTNWKRPLLLVECTILLQQVAWFKSVPSTILANLSDVAVQEEFSAETLCIETGRPCIQQPLRIIVSGELVLQRDDTVVGELGRFSVIGMEIFSPTARYRHNYYAKNSVRVLSIDMFVFLDVISRHMELVEALLDHFRMTVESTREEPSKLAV